MPSFFFKTAEDAVCSQKVRRRKNLSYAHFRMIRDSLNFKSCLTDGEIFQLGGEKKQNSIAPVLIGTIKNFFTLSSDQ